MKSIFKILAFAGLVASASTLSFAQSQVDLGFGYTGADLTGVYSNAKSAATYGQTAQYSPWLNANAKYTYSLKLDDANVLKLALLYDAWLGLHTGSAPSSPTANGGNAGQNAGNVQPSVQWTGYGFDVTAAFPIYYANPADAAGINALGNFGPTRYLPVNTGTYPISGTSAWVTNYTKITYKYSFDKTFWVSAGVELDYGFTPTPWLADVKPQLTVAYAFAQLDTKFGYYSKYFDNDASKYYETYLEPRLTLDFQTLGVPGLKAFVASKHSLTSTSATYNTPTKTYQFRNSWWQPGANYKLSVKDVGDFTIEGSFRFNKFDNDKSTQSIDVAPYADLIVKLGYSVKF